MEAVPCALCKEPTLMTGVKLCVRCWELKTRVERDPRLALEILANLYKDKGTF